MTHTPEETYSPEDLKAAEEYCAYLVDVDQQFEFPLSEINNAFLAGVAHSRRWRDPREQPKDKQLKAENITLQRKILSMIKERGVELLPSGMTAEDIAEYEKLKALFARKAGEGYCAYHPDPGWSNVANLTAAETEEIAWECLWNLLDSDDFSGAPGVSEEMQNSLIEAECDDVQKFIPRAQRAGWTVRPVQIFFSEEEK